MAKTFPIMLFGCSFRSCQAHRISVSFLCFLYTVQVSACYGKSEQRQLCSRICQLHQEKEREGQQRNSGGSYSPDYITEIEGHDQILWSPASYMVALRTFFRATFKFCNQSLHVFFPSNNFITKKYLNLNCLTSSMTHKTKGYLNFAGVKTWEK